MSISVSVSYRFGDIGIGEIVAFRYRYRYRIVSDLSVRDLEIPIYIGLGFRNTDIYRFAETKTDTKPYNRIPST